ncbi:MAG: hypothetical protein PVSMB7_28160 [Chloroflexota bacterium]
MSLIGPDEGHPLPAGTTVFIPPGQVHGFRNTSEAPARHLAITSPALVVTMIEELTRAAAGDAPSVLTRYGSHLEP